MKSAAMWAAVVALTLAGARTAWSHPEDHGGDADDEAVEAPQRPDEPPQPPMPPEGRGRMGEGRGRMMRRAQPLTEAQEKELLGFIQANDARLSRRLSAEKERMPMMYHHRLEELWRMYQDKDVREQFLKQSKAASAVQDLVAQYRKAAPADKPALKEKLTAAVGELFDADVSAKELQVRKMQAEIASLKDKIAKRRQMKDKFVAQRVERLSGEGDDWQW